MCEHTHVCVFVWLTALRCLVQTDVLALWLWLHCAPPPAVSLLIQQPGVPTPPPSSPPPDAHAPACTFINQPSTATTLHHTLFTMIINYLSHSHGLHVHFRIKRLKLLFLFVIQYQSKVGHIFLYVRCLKDIICISTVAKYPNMYTNTTLTLMVLSALIRQKFNLFWS